MNKLTHRVITFLAVAAFILLAQGGAAAPVQAAGNPSSNGFLAQTPISPNGGGGFAPTAISPSGATEFTTPTFIWSAIPGAAMYNIYIYKGRKYFYAAYVYSYNCGITFCQYTPPIKFPTGAEYAWAVSSDVVNVGWSNWGNVLYFTAYSPFSSSFSNSKGWAPVYGTWAAHGGDYIGRQSSSGYYVASAYYTKGQYDTYTYETRSEMVGCSDCDTILYFNGNPLSGITSSGDWENTYYFQYNDDGNYSIYEVYVGTYHEITSGTSSAITPSWNILTVTYNGTTDFAQFFINHVFVADEYLGDFRYGYVGVGAYTYGPTASELLYVDYANLMAGAPDSQVSSGVTPAANFVHFTGKPVATGNAR